MEVSSREEWMLLYFLNFSQRVNGEKETKKMMNRLFWVLSKVKPNIWLQDKITEVIMKINLIDAVLPLVTSHLKTTAL